MLGRSIIWKIFGVAFIFFLGALEVVYSATNDQKFRPAYFADKGTSLIENIKFSTKLESVEKELKCFAKVDKAGQFLSNSCWTGRRDRLEYKLGKSISNALKATAVVPASVDGLAVESSLNFRIVFEKNSEGTRVQFYPNHGWDKNYYGDNYTHAQQYINGNMGRSGCTDGKTKITLRLFISESGTPSDIKVIDAKSLEERCRKSFLYDLSQDKYIPAFYNGMPVQSNHILYFEF